MTRRRALTKHNEDSMSPEERRYFHSPAFKLHKVLKARGLTQKDLAQIIQRPIQAVNEMFLGKKRITARSAIEIGDALCIAPETIMRWQSDYDLFVVRVLNWHDWKPTARRRNEFFEAKAAKWATE
jgi:plasmid maintenance system antidote protein VapI